MTAWKRSGVDTVLSFLTREEERDLDLLQEAAQAHGQGMNFLSYPIPDRQVPISESDLARFLAKLDAELSAGRNVVMHCRQGIGRTGLVAGCLLVTKSLDPEVAVSRLSDVRGIPLPETPEQRQWIDRFAFTLTHRR
ncbi:MAG: dual specificity protein phosphatase family protein [Bryobacterales bacterium]|nr:dual specificity protein phosphatase family protein [Bryobacterales bacterium]